MSVDDKRENLIVQFFLAIIIFLATIMIPALACKYFVDTGEAIPLAISPFDYLINPPHFPPDVINTGV